MSYEHGFDEFHLLSSARLLYHPVYAQVSNHPANKNANYFDHYSSDYFFIRLSLHFICPSIFITPSFFETLQRKFPYIATY